MVEDENKLVFRGYQEFELTKDHIAYLNSNEYLAHKFKTVCYYLSDYYVAQRSILDLGANAGAYSYFALQNNAKFATAIEMDRDYIKGLNAAKNKFFPDKFQVENKNFQDINTKADIVIGLAVIHWFYSCTSKFGSLDKVIQKLADLTNYMLIIEWVNPEDPAIQFFKHIEWNQDIIQEPYTYENFIAALNKYFSRVLYIGNLTKDRQLFVAFKTRHLVSYNSPLPLYEEYKLIQSRVLTEENGLEYWSQIYEHEDYIVKQTTADLAAREGHFLNLLEGGPFPKCLEIDQQETFSRIKISKISGQLLADILKTRQFSQEEIIDITEQLLSILAILEKQGITHRDIHAENIVITPEDKLYLLDFGWAISENQPYFTPDGLPDGPRLPDGSFSDIYSCGKLIEKFNANRFDDISYLVSLMSAEDLNLRVSNLPSLKTLLNLKTRENNKMAINLSEDFVLDIINQNKELYKKLSLLDHEYNALNEKVTELTNTIDQLNQSILLITNEKNQLAQNNQALTNEKIQLGQTIEALTNEKNQLSQAIQTLNNEKEQLTQTIQAITGENNQLSQNIQAISDENNLLKTSVAELQANLNEIYKSKSWKLITFIRKVKYPLTRKK